MPTAKPKLSFVDSLNKQRQQLIVDAAQRIFETDGLEGASIRAIAQRAGCTTGAIYPHFSSKEQIFAAVLARSLDRLNECVVSAMIGARSPMAAIRRGTAALYTYYENRPSELALALYFFNGIQPHNPGKKLNEQLTHQLESILKLFSEQMRTQCKAMMPLIEIESLALFTYVIGLLILRHNDWIESLNKNAAVLLAHYTKQLAKRLR